MTAFRTLNTAVLAPVPNAIVTITTAAKPGATTIDRTAYLRSRNTPPTSGFDGGDGIKVGRAPVQTENPSRNSPMFFGVSTRQAGRKWHSAIELARNCPRP